MKTGLKKSYLTKTGNKKLFKTNGKQNFLEGEPYNRVYQQCIFSIPFHDSTNFCMSPSLGHEASSW